jgi:hypothetical protein
VDQRNFGFAASLVHGRALDSESSPRCPSRLIGCRVDRVDEVVGASLVRRRFLLGFLEESLELVEFPLVVIGGHF